MDTLTLRPAFRPIDVGLLVWAMIADLLFFLGRESRHVARALLFAGLTLTGGQAKALDNATFAISYATTLANSRLNLVRDAVDAGAGAGLRRIYDGSRPATCGTATTLLAELTFSDPCAAAASGRVLTHSAITPDASANATGTATWFRDVDSTGTCVMDGNVGTSGSDYNLNSTSITSGVQVSCTSSAITHPA